ncbi:MAG: hypothetical protein Q4E43_01995 [Akkermansia sp.]|nr:hypothetical protein [Akkermansia sp.]
MSDDIDDLLDVIFRGAAFFFATVLAVVTAPYWIPAALVAGLGYCLYCAILRYSDLKDFKNSDKVKDALAKKIASSRGRVIHLSGRVDSITQGKNGEKKVSVTISHGHTRESFSIGAKEVESNIRVGLEF